MSEDLLPASWLRDSEKGRFINMDAAKTLQNFLRNIYGEVDSYKFVQSPTVTSHSPHHHRPGGLAAKPSAEYVAAILKSAIWVRVCNQWQWFTEDSHAAEGFAADSNFR